MNISVKFRNLERFYLEKVANDRSNNDMCFVNSIALRFNSGGGGLEEAWNIMISCLIPSPNHMVIISICIRL